MKEVGVSVCGGQRQCLDLGLSGSPVQILPHSSDPAQDNHAVYLAEHFGPEVSSFIYRGNEIFPLPQGRVIQWG